MRRGLSTIAKRDFVSEQWLRFIIGAGIRELRHKRGLSMRQMEKLGGVEQSTMSLIERGKRSPSIATLAVVASILDAEIEVRFIPRKGNYE